MFKKFERNNFFKYKIFFILFDKTLYNVDSFEFFVSNRKFYLSLTICFFIFFFNLIFFWIYFIIAIYHFCSSIFFIITLRKRVFFIKSNFLNITFDTTILNFLQYLIFKLYSENSDIYLINLLNEFFIVFKYFKFWWSIKITILCWLSI